MDCHLPHLMVGPWTVKLNSAKSLSNPVFFLCLCSCAVLRGNLRSSPSVSLIVQNKHCSACSVPSGSIVGVQVLTYSSSLQRPRRQSVHTVKINPLSCSPVKANDLWETDSLPETYAGTFLCRAMVIQRRKPLPRAPSVMPCLSMICSLWMSSAFALDMLSNRTSILVSLTT